MNMCSIVLSLRGNEVLFLHSSLSWLIRILFYEAIFLIFGISYKFSYTLSALRVSTEQLLYNKQVRIDSE